MGDDTSKNYAWIFGENCKETFCPEMCKSVWLYWDKRAGKLKKDKSLKPQCGKNKLNILEKYIPLINPYVINGIIHTNNSALPNLIFFVQLTVHQDEFFRHTTLVTRVPVALIDLSRIVQTIHAVRINKQ